MNNEKQLVKLCDELLNDWTTGNDEKSKRAWSRLLRDCKK